MTAIAILQLITPNLYTPETHDSRPSSFQRRIHKSKTVSSLTLEYWYVLSIKEPDAKASWNCVNKVRAVYVFTLPLRLNDRKEKE